MRRVFKAYRHNATLVTNEILTARTKYGDATRGKKRVSSSIPVGAPPTKKIQVNYSTIGFSFDKWSFTKLDIGMESYSYALTHIHRNKYFCILVSMRSWLSVIIITTQCLSNEDGEEVTPELDISLEVDWEDISEVVLEMDDELGNVVPDQLKLQQLTLRTRDARTKTLAAKSAEELPAALEVWPVFSVKDIVRLLSSEILLLLY